MFARALDELHRREGARLLAQLIRRIGRFDVAEESLQDAYAKALARWPVDGVPARPDAWLLRVASHRAIDVLRREKRRAENSEEILESLAAESGDLGDADSWPDERLRLIFTCCHPALAQSAQVALALKTLCGLTTAEIARAFVEPEATTAQKLVRAKRKITEARIPFEVPGPEQFAGRMATVLAVIYFVFNEGYAAASHEALLRPDLCREAMRLGDMLAGLVPDEPEVIGLSALMALHHARQSARCDAQGNLVPLEEQDRARWDHTSIEAADQRLRAALGAGKTGPYQLQAAIAALHARAPSASETDWPQIALLYRALLAHLNTPVVELNAAVALAMSGQLEQGLAWIGCIEAKGALTHYHLLHAARADLLRRAGQVDAAREAYRRAIGLAQNATERAYLERRLAQITRPT